MKTLREAAKAIAFFVVGIAAIIIVGGVIALIVMPSAAPAGSGGVLDHTVIRQGIGGFSVCASQELHQCSIRYGSILGRDFRFYARIVRPPQSCDNQEATAYSLCEDGGIAGPECLSGWGVFGLDTASRDDPRADHLPAGQFVLLCGEGRREGAFENPAF